MAWIRVNVALVLSVVMITACTMGLDPAVLNSAEYHEGYSDGCATAMNQSNGFQSEVVENRARSETNESYIVGWRQGFYACGGRSTDRKTYDTGEWYHDIGD